MYEEVGNFKIPYTISGKNMVIDMADIPEGMSVDSLIKHVKEKREMEKYYTPTIKEIIYGAEYYSIWMDTEYTLNFIDERFLQNFYENIYEYNQGYNLPENSIAKQIRDKQIVFKYLDKEDIESLGWEQSSYNEDIFYIKKDGLTHEIKKSFDQYRITQTHDILPIRNLPCFIGIIKNKSELKKLMQQLGMQMEKGDS